MTRHPASGYGDRGAASPAGVGVAGEVKMGKLPEISPELLRFVARRAAKLTLEQWTALPAGERKRMRAEVRPFLMLERKYLSKKSVRGAAIEK